MTLQGVVENAHCARLASRRNGDRQHRLEGPRRVSAQVRPAPYFKMRRSRASGGLVNDERIAVRVTSSGQVLEVVVFNKRLDMITVVLGEGVHSVRCDLIPTRNGTAYAGNAMGREIVYERSREQVKADLARAAGFRDFRR